MSNLSDYNEIRTGIAAYISANCAWVSSSNIFDYTPTDISVLFAKLPAVSVDFYPGSAIQWLAQNESYVKGIPFVIMIYSEIEKDDSSHGRDASQEIATKLKEIEDLFISEPSIGGLVKSSGIMSSKVETLLIEAKNIGVWSRWAWLTLTVTVLGK